MSETLKPCPVCGCELEVVNIGGGWFWRHINCDEDNPQCPISYSKKYITEKEAIEQINKRTEDIKHNKLFERIKKEITDCDREIREADDEIKRLKEHRLCYDDRRTMLKYLLDIMEEDL